MSTMVRVWSGVAVLVALMTAVPATADDEQVRAASEMVARQEYQAALDLLQTVDRATLSEDAQKKLDELLAMLPAALRAQERVTQDLADADVAYEVAAWDVAQELYRAVIESPHATSAQRERAAGQLARIEEKLELAEAATPVEAVETAEPPPAEPAEEPGAEPAQAPLAQPGAIALVPAQPLQEPRRLTPVEEQRLKEDLLWQQAVAKAEALSKTARLRLADKAFDEARRLVTTALQTIEAAAHFAEPVSKYQAAKQSVLALREEVERAAAQQAEIEADTSRVEIERAIKLRAERIEQLKREKIEQLFNSAEQLRREQRFRESAEMLREILRIDPGNAQARYLLDWAIDLESFDDQRQFSHDLGVQSRRALLSAHEAIIPWDVDVMYPRNFLEITAQRERISASSGGRAIEDMELNRQLDEVLPEIRFVETPFDQAMDFLGNMTSVNISVDWTDLLDSGIERQAPVSLNLNNLSFRVILNEVLSQAGGSDIRLGFSVGDGLLRIATKEKLARDKLVLIYDIRDLLVSVSRADRASGMDVAQGMQQAGQGGQGGYGGGGGLFGGGQGGQYGGNQQQQGGEEQRGVLVDQLIDIIRQMVEPDSWRETGGGDASIRELNGQLIIYNTSDAHRQVADLLSQLRETRALQINVETRFLNVVNNFLEEFGVDLDFVLNSGSAGYDQAFSQGAVVTDPATGAVVLIPRPYSRIGNYPAVPAFGQPLTPGAAPGQPYGQAGFVPTSGGIVPHEQRLTPVTVQQGGISLAQPTGGTGVPGSFGSAAGLTPALNIAGSFLDNLQVDFLIRATQANSRSSVVQAPRLVLFNGQASQIQIGRSRSYVRSLEPRFAEGAGGFAPQIADAQSGVRMWVEGTISADRRYVTLTLFVQQLEEPSFERFEVQRASGNSPGAFILLPDIGFAIIETTVSVPDGGTVLLGGMKHVGEIEVEAGVPILSKIPVLKRAFSNRTMIKDTRTLLVLVKSKIIIQKEAEQEAFGTFTRTGI